MTIRIVALTLLPQVGSSPVSSPISWIIPFLGDSIVGLTAPILAVLLWWKKGLAVWTTGIVWTVFGTWDLFTGLILENVNPWLNNPLGGSTRFIPFFVLSFLNLYLLSRSDVRHYFLDSD